MASTVTHGAVDGEEINMRKVKSICNENDSEDCEESLEGRLLLRPQTLISDSAVARESKE